jgi:NADH dehydrogenase [ubiquinone] 1 alpha subcomplex assembly factor 7
VANEFFDAMPIRQYVRTGRGWCERMISLDATGSLVFALAPVALAPGRVPSNRDGAPAGGVYETSPVSEALVEVISFRIAQSGGAALVVDYGYGADVGFAETLQALKSHTFTDVLTGPGDCDLSAHVDFAALAQAATHRGAKVAGPVPQGNFLDNLGIRQRAEILAQAAGAKPDQVESQVARLIDADQMGLLFKVLAILPSNAPNPPGL